jgi:signal transduction histidine kinase
VSCRRSRCGFASAGGLIRIRPWVDDVCSTRIYSLSVNRRREPLGLPMIDVALAAGLFALKFLFVLTGTFTSGGRTPFAFVSAAALTLPLAWRRRAPLAVASIVAGAIAVDDLVAGWDGAVISFDCSIIAAYSSGAYARQRRALAALAILMAANLVDALGAPGNRAGDLALGLVVFTLVPWLVGQALRRERRRSAQLADLAAQLEAEREQRERAAVAAERGRIARELHDIVAHAISVVAVQANAAAKLLDRDPARAREPLETIQETARGALAEMRRLVGVLRVTEEVPLGPQPGLAEIERLIDEAERSGLPVTLEVGGVPSTLPASIALAAYRIVQEGLTNARKHAGPAHAFVVITYEPESVAVEVRDDGQATASSNGGGFGLVGIKERVTLLGGNVESGPREDGGFLLRARLPLVAPAP